MPMGLIPDARESRPEGPPAHEASMLDRASRIDHLERTVDRYRRDLGLMTETLVPTRLNIDDLAIMDRYASSDDQQGLINDRILRIKTLEAMLHLLRENHGGGVYRTVR
jgi:hypothetical protein